MIGKNRAKKCLQELAAILNGAGTNGTAVRDIVSALRGPDGAHALNAGDKVKDRTTAVIRRQIGLGGECGLVVAAIDVSLPIEYRHGPMPDMDAVNTPHFVGHIRRAWMALEMLGLAEKKLSPARVPKKKKVAK